MSIRYVKTDFANGIDFTVTLEATGEAVMVGTDVNSSASYYPRVGITDTAGAARLYAAAGQAVAEPITLVGDRVKIVVAAGGNVKTGTFHVIIG